MSEEKPAPKGAEPPATGQKRSDSSEKDHSKEKEAADKRSTKRSPKSKSPAKADDATPKQGGSGGAIALALLVGAGAAGGGYYLWQQQQRLNTGLQQQISELQSTLTTRLDNNRSAIDSLGRKIESGDGKLADRLNVTEQSLTTLREQMGRDRRGWAEAEVEHLLRLANQRLQLARDVKSAIGALTTADQRLAAIGEPAYTPVREMIANEIQALRARVDVDLEGMALRLSSLAKSVDSLPLAATPQAPSPQASNQAPTSAAPQTGDKPPVADWRQFLSALWRDIRGLVTISRVNRSDQAPVLIPEERYFLRQNLRLKLEAARLALLQRQDGIYNQALAEATEWLQDYYKIDSPEVQGALNTIGELHQRKPQQPDVDISGSLRRLRDISAELTRQRKGGEQ